MYKKLRNYCIGTAMLFLSATLLTGCQKDTATLSENNLLEEPAAKSLDIETRTDCPLSDLFAYLDETAAEIPYAYAQISIAVTDSSEEETEESIEDSDYEFRQDIVKMEGTADISWQTFRTAEEFQEYFSRQDHEEGIVSKEADTNQIAFAYYQYHLEEGIHAIDIDRFLKERYDKEENPIYAITLNEKRNPSSYCFFQSGERELVVMDGVLYGLDCKGFTGELERDDVHTLLMAYSTQKQKVKSYNGWGMTEERLYWLDHDERITSLENPTRVFTEVRGIDTTWDGTLYMENFALLKEADYLITICENGPLLQLHFTFAEKIPESGYEAYLLNGFCMDEAYEMTVINAETNELLQNQKVEMSIEMPDMITFTDLDGDGCLDMQIGKPTHWSGERALMDEYAGLDFMLWNPKENIFERKNEREVAESLAQNQKSTASTEYLVQSGDTLWGISKKIYGTGTRYAEIEAYNTDVLSGYEYLMPGMLLRIP